MSLALTWCVVIITTTVAWSFHFEYERNFSKPADYVTFAGRGAITYAITNTDIRTVHIHTTYYRIGQNESGLARLSSLCGSEKGFGRETKLVDHPYYPDSGSLLFASADDPDTLQGNAYLFTGKWDAWTQLQQLSPPPEHTYSDFGKVLDVDTSTLSTAVVGCPYCNDTKWAGQIYVYSPNPSKSGDTALSHSWSQSQVLSTEYYDFNEHPDKVAFFLGSRVQVQGDVILGMAQLFPNLAALAFVRNSDTGLWSYQQELVLESAVSDFAVYDDTIVLTSTSEDVAGFSEAGAAHVFYPNTNAYFVLSASEDESKKSVSSKSARNRNGVHLASSVSSNGRHNGGGHRKLVNLFPKSTQWSQQQVLHSPSPSNSNNFGSDVSLQKNHLVIGEQGTSTVYLFNRPGVLGSAWSQVQVLKATAEGVEYFSRSFFHGTSLAVAGIIGTQTHLETFTSSADWKCLVIHVMDSFGDGWGSSQLQVQTPVGGAFDYYSPVCNYPNPFTFRYCPLYPEDGGTYTFSVPEGTLSQYYWEIHFQIYEENSKTWFHGDSSTEVSFDFDSTELSFSFLEGRNVLPVVDSCQVCPVTSPFDSWAYLEVLMTSEEGHSWFQDSYRGTSYSISDAEGRRELVAGRMCNPSPSEGKTNYSCWHVLVDGQYTFRVSDDLNDRQGGEAMSWSFCNSTGTENVHMFFEISGGHCTVVAMYSLESYCNSQLNAQSVVAITVDMFNTSGSFTAFDRADFSTTLASFVSFLDPRDVQFVKVSSSAALADSSLNVTTVSLNLIINAAKGGADPRSLSSMRSMTSAVVTSMEQEMAPGGGFFSHLKLSSSYNSTHFLHMTSLSLVTIAVQDSIDIIVPTQLHPYATVVTADGNSFINEA